MVRESLISRCFRKHFPRSIYFISPYERGAPLRLGREFLHTRWILNHDSALIALHDPEAIRTDREQFDMTMAFIRPVINDMTWASGVWFGGRLVNISDASPFLLFWAYQAITIYRRLEGQYGHEVKQHMLLMREKLRIMSQRWKAGDAYVQILNAREITMMWWTCTVKHRRSDELNLQHTNFHHFNFIYYTSKASNASFLTLCNGIPPCFTFRWLFPALQCTHPQ